MPFLDSDTFILDMTATMFKRRGEPLQQLMNYLVVVPVFLAMGFSFSFLAGVASYPSFYRYFPEVDTITTVGAEKTHNSLIKGVTVSTLNMGAAIGCLSTMYLGNKLGRRWPVVIGAALTLVGTILQCAAFSLPQLIVARCEWSLCTSSSGPSLIGQCFLAEGSASCRRPSQSGSPRRAKFTPAVITSLSMASASRPVSPSHHG